MACRSFRFRAAADVYDEASSDDGAESVCLGQDNLNSSEEEHEEVISLELRRVKVKGLVDSWLANSGEY